MMDKIIKFKGVSKIYGEGENQTYALKNVDFSIDKGEFVVVLGPSGAGKSTILNILGGMDRVSQGDVIINGESITSYNDRELAKYRAMNIGFVFQFYNLIPTLTVYENVALMKEIKKDILDVKEILEGLGIASHMHKFPSQLSGGEQQRVSIARAITKNPTILLCDEPTGALDSTTGEMVLTELKKACKEHHHTTIIVTHNMALSEAADKVIYIKNGGVEKVVAQASPCEISEVKW